MCCGDFGGHFVVVCAHLCLLLYGGIVYYLGRYLRRLSSTAGRLIDTYVPTYILIAKDHIFDLRQQSQETNGWCWLAPKKQGRENEESWIVYRLVWYLPLILKLYVPTSNYSQGTYSQTEKGR